MESHMLALLGPRGTVPRAFFAHARQLVPIAEEHETGGQVQQALEGVDPQGGRTRDRVTVDVKRHVCQQALALPEVEQLFKPGPGLRQIVSFINKSYARHLKAKTI